MVASMLGDERYVSKISRHSLSNYDDLGLQQSTSNGMHEAAVKRVESHHRVLEALKKAGTKPDIIRSVWRP
jgi:hypothetical protein